MEKFETLTGIAATLPRENIDTDAIIPAAWLVNYGRDLSQGLFAGWRYDEAGREKPEFVLNREPFRRARILLAGRNFGCGSSREEAVWALAGFGIRCVIAPSYSDIFFDNSFKNSLLPIMLDEVAIASLTADPAFAADPTLTVDLHACTVSVRGGTANIAFTVEAARRNALLLGLDHVGLTLTHAEAIADFQGRDRARRPWIHRAQERGNG